jgi:hypothetical protein
MKVYVIKGASGEWSDSVNWLTFAYKTKGVAEIICSYLNELKKKKIYNTSEDDSEDKYDELNSTYKYLSKNEEEFLANYYPENEIDWLDESYFTYYKVEVRDGETITIQG